MKQQSAQNDGAALMWLCGASEREVQAGFVCVSALVSQLMSNDFNGIFNFSSLFKHLFISALIDCVFGFFLTTKGLCSLE